MNVLVIQTAYLGDMLLTLPLLDLLRGSPAVSKVGVLAAPAGARLLETQNLVDTIIEFDKREADGGPIGTLRAARVAREFGADAALVPHRSFRSAAIAAMAGAPRRIGFDESGGRALLTQIVPYRVFGHEIERVASLAAAIGVPPPEGRIPFRVRVPEDGTRRVRAKLAGVDAPRGMAVLAPGSRWATKRWPAERYASLAERLTASGFAVVLAGGDEDREVSADVASRARTDTIDLTGQLDLAQWLALVAQSAVAVSNDSAAAHVAAGLGVPVVAVFGPTVPLQGFAPYSERARVVAARLDCRPCGRHGSDRCALGTLQCMLDVDVESVHDAVLGLLGGAGHGADAS